MKPVKRRPFAKLVRLQVTDDAITLCVNNILHLSMRRDDLIGIQSWELDGKYCIEYTLRDRNILTEYNKSEKWQAILDLLDKAELFGR